MDPILKVGISGLGRSGGNIHFRALKHMTDKFVLAGVYDPITERAQEISAESGAKAFGSFEEMLAAPEIDLIVVASPNKFHCPQTIQALEAGKNVLCEKPFGLQISDVDAMITASRKAGKLLQPFQQRRYEKDFLKIKEICDSGLLGEIKFIRIAWHGFKRRWDWQTLRECAGGSLNNNGPHPIDHAMVLMGAEDPDVWAEAAAYLTCGDGEDHVKIIMSKPGHPTVDIELSDIFSYPQDRWMVCGTAGTLKGNPDKLEWQWVDWNTMPERAVDKRPTPDRGYNKEDLNWQSDSWTPATKSDGGAGANPAPQPVIDLYTGMWNTICKGVPQAVTPESVRQRIAVIEKVRSSAHIPEPVK